MATIYDSPMSTEIQHEFAQMQNWRATFQNHWEEIAAILLPTMKNTFVYGAVNTPGEKKTEQQIDATAMLALHRFAAILDSLNTPRNMVWHTLQSNDTEIMKDRRARLWYQAATQKLFQHRYAPIANFSSQNQQVYQSLGAFGTGALFVDQAVDAAGRKLAALRYSARPLGECFLRENHQGLVDGFIRWFRLNARQAAQKWGEENLPTCMRAAYETKSQQRFNFLHRVVPRSDYQPDRLDAKGKLFGSWYVCVEGGYCIMEEGGYNTLPLIATRYDQAPGEIYGRGPGNMCLPAIKSLNAMKVTQLKQAHRSADPVLLTADDGLMSVSMKPGAQNPGGMSADGKPLVGVLPTGDYQITKEAMGEERTLIGDAFLTTLFQILVETPQMSATEVLERTNEKGILLAPTVGRQQSEYLGPMITREVDLLAELGQLPPMPDILREAGGQYDVNYTSPLARMMRSQEVAGFGRALETTLTVVNATQDPEPLDLFDFDTAIKDMAMIQAVPESWMADPKKVLEKRARRAQQMQQQLEIQAAPAAAAMMKAEGMAAKGSGQGSQ